MNTTGCKPCGSEGAKVPATHTVTLERPWGVVTYPACREHAALKGGEAR